MYYDKYIVCFFFCVLKNRFNVNSFPDEFENMNSSHEFLKKVYPSLKAAIEWNINHTNYSLPYQLINTNDEHGIIG